MKKGTISRWIMRCTVIVLMITVGVSAAANYQINYKGLLKQRTEWAEACNDIVQGQLRHWNFQELFESADSSQYRSVRQIIHRFCSAFQFDYLYVYTLDPETGDRFYYLCVSSEQSLNEFAEKELTMATMTGTKILEGEKAIFAGERDMQQGFIKNRFGSEINWVAPFLDENGQMVALIGMDYDLEDWYYLIWQDFLKDIIPIVLVQLLGLAVLLYLVQRRVVQPIREISDGMTRFARNTRQKPEPLQVHSRDEIGGIAASFDKMAEDISDYVNNIETLTREQVETNVQLDVARRIQYGMVPHEAALSGSGYSVRALTRPAKAVGGDFYDCFQRDPHSVCAVMGDVSGKGVSAAIFMAMSKTMIREKLMAGLAPAEALRQVNGELCAQNPEGLFVTVFASVFDPASGEMRFANAGHTYPVLLTDSPALLIRENGPALGLFEDAELQEETLRLKPGQGLLLYTDGVTEAVNPQKAFFGTDRLLKAVRAVPEGGDRAEAAIMEVSRAVGLFCDGAEPFDDMAVMSLLCEEQGEKWQPLLVALSAFEEIRQAVFQTVGDTPKTRQALLACDETLANIVNYSGASELAFSCRKEGDRLRVSFRDDGIPFDPTAQETGEKEFHLLDSGGMGLNLIRQTATKWRYERTGERNIFTLDFQL